MPMPAPIPSGKPDGAVRYLRRLLVPRTSFPCLACLFTIICLMPTMPMQARASDRQLRIGYIPNITQAQALYGRATGAFEKAVGVPVRWIPFNAGTTVVEALFIDEIDLAFLGPGPTINGFMKSRGKKFVIVAGAASGGSGLIVRRGSGIRTDRDFGGKVIATPQLGNSQDLAARAWFAGKGYRLREKGGNLNLVNLSNPDQLTMFRRRQIDGAWTVEPWMSRLELEGAGRLFLDEKTLWPGGRYVTTHLVVNRRFLAGNRGLVKRFLAAHVAVTRLIEADKAAAAVIVNGQLKRETGRSLRPDVIARSLDRVTLTWDPVASSLEKNAETAYSAGFLRRAPRLEGIYSLDLLNSVLQEKHLPEVRSAAH